MTMDFSSSYSHAYRIASTDSKRQVVWIISRLVDGSKKTIISKVDQDLNSEIVASFDIAPNDYAFTVTPNGASLLFSPLVSELTIYWIDAQNGNIIGSLYDNSADFEDSSYLFANTDSSSVYFYNLVSGIQKV